LLHFVPSSWRPYFITNHVHQSLTKPSPFVQTHLHPLPFLLCPFFCILTPTSTLTSPPLICYKSSPQHQANRLRHSSLQPWFYYPLLNHARQWICQWMTNPSQVKGLILLKPFDSIRPFVEAGPYRGGWDPFPQYGYLWVSSYGSVLWWDGWVHLPCWLVGL
jgi:hypothetical protein